MLSIRTLFSAFLASALFFTFSSCNGSKALMKRGEKMEDAGMISQAAEYYYKAATRKRSNVDAVIALNRAGQYVLNEKLTAFDDAGRLGNRAEAVSNYEEAVAYHEKIARIGVDLLFPSHARQAFADIRDAHMEDLYNEGMRALEDERFESALEAFEEIVRLDNGFRDAAAQADLAYCEPRYRTGVKALAEQSYRTAYQALSACLSRDDGFKDAADLKAESLELGQFTLALIAFENSSIRHGMDTKFQSYVQQELTRSTDPFLRLVDRTHQDLVLQEQQLALSGMLDESTAVEVGGLLGAKAIIKGTVVDCEVNTTRLRYDNMKGFESYKVERVNEDGKKYYETKYRSVTYREYRQARSVNVTFHLVLISLETGETISSEMISRKRTDEIRYARYDGNQTKLYPSQTSGSVHRRGKNQLDALFGARATLEGEGAMVNAAAQQAATAIRQAIEGEILKLVP